MSKENLFLIKVKHLTDHLHYMEVFPQNTTSMATVCGQGQLA